MSKKWCVIGMLSIGLWSGCLSVEQLPRHEASDESDAGSQEDEQAGDAGLPVPPDPLPEGCEGDEWGCEESAACNSDCTANVCGDRKYNWLTEDCDDGNDDPLDGCHRCVARDTVISTFTEAEEVVISGRDIFVGTETLLLQSALGSNPKWAVAHGFSEGL